MRTLILTVIFSVAIVGCAAAQCPTQPTGPVLGPKNACFTPGDYAATDAYRLQIKKQDGSEVSKTDIGKPALQNGVVQVLNFAGFSSLPVGACTSAAPCTLTTIAVYGTTEVPDGLSVGFFNPAAPGTAVVW